MYQFIKQCYMHLFVELFLDDIGRSMGTTLAMLFVRIGIISALHLK